MKPKQPLVFAIWAIVLVVLCGNKAGAQDSSLDTWKSYAIGSSGLFLDLPKAPEPARMVNGAMTSGFYAGAFAVDVREVMSTAYNPDFASKQMLTILQAWPKHENVQGIIDKRMINGLEARLLRTTHKNGSFLNHREMLLIYSYDRFWAIDAIAAENEKGYIARVIDSAVVRLPTSAGWQRQQIGKVGASLMVGPKVLEVKRQETPNDSLILSNEIASTGLGPGALVVVEMTYKDESPQLKSSLGVAAVGGLLNLLSDGAGVKMTGTLRDFFPVNIDRTEGLHLVFDVTAGAKTVQGDFVMLRDGKRWWTVFVATDPAREDSRLARAQVLNTIRVNH